MRTMLACQLSRDIKPQQRTRLQQASTPLRYQPLPQCRALHHKDIEKPTMFNWNVDGWLPWSKSFKKFLRQTNAPWA